MSQTIVFIPARIGSKSIPKKNIKSFLDKPLIYWVIKAAQDCSIVNKIVLSIDSTEIIDKISHFQFSKLEVFHRASDTATDEASTESAILEYLEQSSLNIIDIVVLLQATSPFTSSEDIKGALQLMINHPYDSIISCVRRKYFIWSEAGEALNYDVLNRPRRQDFDGHLQENGAIYISSVGSILSERCRVSGRIGIFEMAAHKGFEIDEPEDWIIAESLMKSQRQKNLRL